MINPKDIANDMARVTRFVEDHPDISTFPPGFAISESIAEFIETNARFALAEGYSVLDCKSKEDSLEQFKTCAEILATGTVLLVSDIQTTLTLSGNLSAPGEEAELKEIAEQFYPSEFEGRLSQLENFEYVRASAELFARSVIWLAALRRDVMQASPLSTVQVH